MAGRVERRTRGPSIRVERVMNEVGRSQDQREGEGPGEARGRARGNAGGTPSSTPAKHDGRGQSRSG